jgi:HEAT repeat protein
MVAFGGLALLLWAFSSYESKERRMWAQLNAARNSRELYESLMYFRTNKTSVEDNHIVKVLARALETEGSRVRSSAAIELVTFPSEARHIVPVLAAHATGDPDPIVRIACIETLSDLYEERSDGESYQEAYRALLQIRSDENSVVRLRGAKALIEIGKSQDALPVLEALSRSDDKYCREKALDLLTKSGRRAGP